MRAMIFPRGRTYFAPSDRLSAQLAELAMTPGPSRERLCAHAFRSPIAGNPLGALQEVLLLAAKVEPIERRLRVDGVKTGRIRSLGVAAQVAEGRAIGLLSEEEAGLLLDYDRRIMDIIHVDDFAPSELPAGQPAH